MKHILKKAGTLIIIIISLSLCCTSMARKQADHTTNVLTRTQAQKIAENGTAVRFADENGFYPDCRILGWTEAGFILDWGGRIDTADYDIFKPEIRIATGQSNSGSGAKLGLGIGLGLTALLFAYSIDEYNHSNSDMKGMLIIFPIISAPVLIGIPTALGAWSGSKTNRYETLKFDYREFQNFAWQPDHQIKPIRFRGN